VTIQAIEQLGFAIDMLYCGKTRSDDYLCLFILFIWSKCSTRRVCSHIL